MNHLIKFKTDDYEQLARVTSSTKTIHQFFETDLPSVEKLYNAQFHDDTEGEISEDSFIEMFKDLGYGIEFVIEDLTVNF